MNNEKSASRAAVIDIGSNSVRYMEAAVTNESVAACYKELTTTRLCDGMEKNGALSEAAMVRSIEAIGNYKRRADTMEVFAYATSAVRDAKNKNEFLDRVYNETGVRIDVLSGEEEARCAYLGATRGGALIDIGGGSAQVMTEASAKSFPIGCIRLKDTFPCERISSVRNEIEKWIESRTLGLEPLDMRCTGVGGTITTLGALKANLSKYDSKAISTTVITSGDVEDLILKLDEWGDDRRKEHPMLIKRHDIILYGAVVLAYLMRVLEVDSVHCSDADGMEGFLRLKMK